MITPSTSRLSTFVLTLVLTVAFSWGLLRAPAPHAAPESAAGLAEGELPRILLPLSLHGEMPTADLRPSSTVVSTDSPSPSSTLTATATFTPTLAPTPFGTCPEPRRRCNPCPGCTSTPMPGDGTPVVCPICRPRVAAATTPDPAQEHFLPLFAPAPAVGEVRALPELAETLRAIAETHGEDFYSGDVAARIADFAAATGGVLTREDLAAHRSEWVEPISAR
ncbi:MAG TPA: gamma-glutamyltransferase, partial [Anaerolineae bacterium]|nr:gamma-glutamyltransferase [Anaerolineae bacterium]